jgi:hypothetical protein
MFYDLAMRDVEIALGAFALAQISALRRQDAFHSDAEAPSPLVMHR